MLRGHITADETFIGGKPSNRHKGSTAGTHGKPQPIKPGERASVAGKSAVLTLIDQATGEARSQVVPNVTGATLRKVMAEQIDMGGTTLHTDGALAYQTFGHEFASHLTTNHEADEYVRVVDGVTTTTNHAEGYFSQLKRSLDGTHHNVSAEHLDRYLAEFDYRYSTRKMNDSMRMRLVMGQTGGRRLSYRPLTEGGE
jgi:hypothetical protein